jgi:hypothetical protein
VGEGEVSEYFPTTRSGASRKVLRNARRLGLRLDDLVAAAGGAAAAGGQFTYILHACGKVKVGRASNIDARIRQIQCGCPEMIEPVVACGPVDKKIAASLETELHRRMGFLRSYGEWFACTTEQATALLAAIAFSFVGSRFYHFGNDHSFTVLACCERESACRSGRGAEKEAARHDADRVLSVFQAGHGSPVRRKSNLKRHSLFGVMEATA